MRSYTNLAISTLAAVAVAPALAAEEFMEPRVTRYAGVLPPSVCKELIRLGEQSGFNVIEESIDDYQVNPMPSQSIEVLGYVEGGENRIDDKAIWEALEPYTDVFAELVKQTRREEEHFELYPDEPDREPVLDWIFFRKYSPTSNRNSLIPHVGRSLLVYCYRLFTLLKPAHLHYAYCSRRYKCIHTQYCTERRF